MTFEELNPTPAELESIIERFQKIRDRWGGEANKDYARQIDVEIWALKTALFLLTKEPPKPECEYCHDRHDQRIACPASVAASTTLLRS